MKKKITIFTLVLTLIFSATSLDVFAASKTTTIQQLQKKISELTKQVKSLSSSISTKTKENKDLKSKLEKVTKDLNNLNSDNKSLKQQIEEKDNEIYEKNKKIEELNKQAKKNEQLHNAEIIYTDSNGISVSKDREGAIQWHKFKTEMATIYLTPSAYKEFSYLLDISDPILIETAKYFGVTKFSKQISVYVWLDENITKNRNGEYGNYFYGENNIFINGKIHKLWNDKNRGNFTKTYVHEFAHAFQDDVINLFPIRIATGTDMLWLMEGMADYVVHQHVGYDKYSLPSEQTPVKAKYSLGTYSNYIKGSLKESNVNIDSIVGIPNATRYSGYAIYESMIYYIETIYGHNKFFNFIEGLRFQSINDSMVKNFGVTETQFIQDWKMYYSL
jgi:regulator of replication initiation timing